MALMIQIEESKLDKMSEYTEKMLKYGGKLMSCLSELEEESGMGHRGGRYGGNMGYRHEDDEMRMGMRGRMNYRDEEDDDDWEMGERRGRRRRDSRGRYM